MRFQLGTYGGGPSFFRSSPQKENGTREMIATREERLLPEKNYCQLKGKTAKRKKILAPDRKDFHQRKNMATWGRIPPLRERKYRPRSEQIATKAEAGAAMYPPAGAGCLFYGTRGHLGSHKSAKMPRWKRIHLVRAKLKYNPAEREAVSLPAAARSHISATLLHIWSELLTDSDALFQIWYSARVRGSPGSTHSRESASPPDRPRARIRLALRPNFTKSPVIIGL